MVLLVTQLGQTGKNQVILLNGVAKTIQKDVLGGMKGKVKNDVFTQSMKKQKPLAGDR